MTTPMIKSGITVRRMDFEFHDIPRYWFDNNVLLTHLHNAMSVTFPEGERFFVESVRAYRDRITDPVLQKEVGAFIGQEAMHSKEHEAFNRYLETLGLDIAGIEQQVLKNINFTRANCTPDVKLAITCALEHFTAIMAEQILGNPELMQRMHPDMLKLWAWHAIEETEHKGVAFDVYKALVNDEALRRSVMRRVTFFFIYRNTKFMLKLLREDGQLFKPSVWYKGVTALWGKNGYFRGMWASYREYYRADFHPWQRDSRAMVEEWKQRLRLDELVKTRPPLAVVPVDESAAAEPEVSVATVVEAAPKPARKPRAKKAATDLTDAVTPKPRRAPRRKPADPEPQLH